MRSFSYLRSACLKLTHPRCALVTEHMFHPAFMTNPMEQSPTQKLIVAQLVKKFPACYGIRRPITIFETTHYWPLLSQMTPVHTLTSCLF